MLGLYFQHGQEHFLVESAKYEKKRSYETISVFIKLEENIFIKPYILTYFTQCGQCIQKRLKVKLNASPLSKPDSPNESKNFGCVDFFWKNLSGNL